MRSSTINCSFSFFFALYDTSRILIIRLESCIKDNKISESAGNTAIAVSWEGWACYCKEFGDFLLFLLKIFSYKYILYYFFHVQSLITPNFQFIFIKDSKRRKIQKFSCFWYQKVKGTVPIICLVSSFPDENCVYV